jgi:putative PEP-CTERM system TPR-repeat lipoprotein
MAISKIALRACLILSGALSMLAHGLALATIISDEPSEMHSGVTEREVRQINSLLAQKQLDKAMQEVEALEKQQPQDANTYILKGAVLLARRDPAAARKSFERALELNPKSVAASMNLAQLDLLEKNLQSAQRRYQGVLTIDPKNTDAMLGLAGIAAGTGRDAEVVSWLEKAIAAGPGLVRPRVLLSTYYLQKRDAQKALAIAKQAQALDADNSEALDALGAAQLATNEPDAAVASYRKLTALAPTDPAAHYKLGMAQAAARDIEGSRASLNRALQLKPDFLQAKVELAAVELRAGAYGESLRIAKEIQKQHPSSSVGWTLEGDVLMDQKQYAQAEKAYERAFGIRKSGMVAVKLHDALNAAGKSKAADSILLDWLKDHPADVAVRSYLAMSYLKNGNNKEAIRQYETVVQSAPREVVALNDLAWLYQQENDSRAADTAERAYQLAPENAQVLDTLGWILANKGDVDRSVKLLRRAAELVPSSPVIRYHLAASLAKTGANVPARVELEALLKKDTAFRERPQAEALLKQLKN